MADQVETRIRSIKTLGGQSGEGRLLVLAALLMADELHDLRIELEGLRRGAPAKKSDSETSRKISRLAARAEQIAAGLEGH
jgi:cell division protein ZapA